MTHFHDLKGSLTDVFMSEVPVELLSAVSNCNCFINLRALSHSLPLKGAVRDSGERQVIAESHSQLVECRRFWGREPPTQPPGNETQ